MKKRKICVMLGGKSSEYEVSLRSAYEVLTQLDKMNYEITVIGITRCGKWLLFKGEYEEILNGVWEKSKKNVRVGIDPSRGKLIELGKKIREIDIEVVFPVMHGEYVEDGRLQGLFDIAGIKYVGCSSFSSHACMDKHISKSVARELGINVAKWVKITKNTPICVDNLTFPLFVKPNLGGSSVGASRVEQSELLSSAVSNALSYSDSVLIEEAIEGNEIEVGVLEANKELIVSSVGMLSYEGSFYDYFAKYNSEKTRYLIPAPIDKETEEYIKARAKELFLALGCSGLARFDFFLKKSGDVVFNEVNTMPGFTKGSMYPMMFNNMGIPFDSLLSHILS